MRLSLKGYPGLQLAIGALIIIGATWVFGIIAEDVVTGDRLTTVIAYEYEDRAILRYGAYSLATAVSLSRFGGRRHFLSDVLVGSAIGYGIGRYVYKKHHDLRLDTNHDQDTKHRATSKLLPLITPQFSGRARGYGVSLSWSF